MFDRLVCICIILLLFVSQSTQIKEPRRSLRLQLKSYKATPYARPNEYYNIRRAMGMQPRNIADRECRNIARCLTNNSCDCERGMRIEILIMCISTRSSISRRILRDYTNVVGLYRSSCPGSYLPHISDYDDVCDCE